LNFTEVAADLRRAFWIHVGQGFHHQAFVRVYQHFAVGADQERVAHATEVQRANVIHQGLQAQVAAHHANALAAFGAGGGDGNDQLTCSGVDIRLGQGRAVAALGALVPGANTWVEAIRHLGVGADGEGPFAVTNVGCHEGRRQGFLFQQAGNGRRLRVDSDVLCSVFHQRNTPGEPGLNVACGDIAHFVQVAVEVFTNGVTLQVVVVEGE